MKQRVRLSPEEIAMARAEFCPARHPDEQGALTLSHKLDHLIFISLYYYLCFILFVIIML